MARKIQDLFSLFLLLSLGACGQNAHVTKEDALLEQDKKEGGESNIPAAGKPSLEKPDSLVTPLPSPEDLTLFQEAPCRKDRLSDAYPARPMTPTERKSFVLPYKSARETIGIRDLFETEGHGNGEIPYVLDDLVLLMTEVCLPARGKVKALQALELHMNLTKLSSDIWPTTELFCFLDKKLCSGILYGAPNFIPSINKEFWAHVPGQEPSNTHFAERVLGLRVPYPSNSTRLYQGVLDALSFEEVLETSGVKPLNYLYAPVPKGGTKEGIRLILIAIADDVQVSALSIRFEVEVEGE